MSPVGWFFLGFDAGLLAGIFLAWFAFALDEASQDHNFGGE